ncbi:MAG: PAS domain-containing protein [Candidatus Bathyarchaeota archaeon]|nr:PAS domain-containing protein [Candidatus Bathyarchaeum sp.]
MTVTQISKEINLNRNSVAKYLEVLLISGHVEMKSYGPAKVFFISQRVPMSALIDFSSDYILILDRDFKVIKANDNFQKLVRLEVDALIGQKIEFVPLSEFSTQKMKADLKDALNGKSVTTEMEFSIGAIKYTFNTKIIPTTFEDGLPGVTMIFEDITARKMMEAELRKSEQRYRRLIESITDGVYVVNHDLMLVLVNDAGGCLLGIPKEKLLGTKVTDLPSHIKETPFFKAFNQVMKTRKPDTVTSEHTYSDGRKGWYEVRLYPVPEGILAIVVDITKRKVAEAELMRLSNAMRMSTDSIVITDIDTRILDVNEATLEMYGAREKDELIGKYAFELLDPEAQSSASGALTELMKKGSKKILKFKVQTLGGTKFLEVSLGLMKDDNDKPMGLVAISRDVTASNKTK